MKVSIVTPSYNQAQYLEQTIRSVLEQDYAPVEYFIIDGGSGDGSLEIIQQYAGQLSGWVSEKDRGQADAINKGLKQAGGEIVAWLNSDDYYLPGAISCAVQVFQQHPEAGLVYGDVLSVDGAGHPFNLQTFQPSNLNDLMAFRIISQPAVFMRRAVLEQAGFLDESYHMLLDHHLWLRMARLAPMVYIPKTLAAARYHAEAKNLARTAEFGQEAFRILAWMQSDPRFVDEFRRNEKRIRGGAQRFNAFYLLEGHNYVGALASYAKAFRYSPPVVLREAHRVIFAILGLLGLGRLRKVYMVLRGKIKTFNHEGHEEHEGLKLKV
jgi:glycosyltransferase involved in cell wall biosynthesis